jgi:Tol biopolymer transport system component
MSTGPWREVEKIFHEALQRDPVQRDAYMREACHGDPELHRDVSSLLANHSEGTGELWAATAAAQLVNSSTSLQPGQSLGPYRIEFFVAAGGMGEVYRATDTRLHREVAIKVSAARFSERFEREARVIASLNHPHICQLYDVGPNYLVMELVDGVTLRGPLPLKQAVEYAGQILDALNAAHRKGITHRDLKPANTLVTKQGIKLLDFGLARQSGPLQEHDATLTAGVTGKGQIIGTLQYMPPEQLQGKEADARSDLFSFGCVLYEMLSGRRAFEGQSTASVIAAILEREPAPLNLAPPLERVIRTCLAKDPDHRFQNALDVKRDLIWALEGPPDNKTNRRWWIAAAATMVLGAVGGGLAVSPFHQQPADDQVIRFQIAPPEGWGISGGGNLGGGFAISPDGKTAAFVGVVKGKTALWVRPLDAANARLIRGTEGASRPFWSPDSRSIAFSADRATLQRVDLARETISKICDISGVYWGGSWSNDGRILFVSRDRGIFQVAASGGTPSPLTALDSAHGEGNHLHPQTLPGGRFLYAVTSVVPEKAGVYAAALAKPTERVRLLADAIQAQYASSKDGEDYLLWIRDQTLLAQRFDAGRLQLIGEPHPLADPAAMASVGSRVLLYGPSIALRQFKWLDRKGNEVGFLGEPGPWAFSHISPDGRRVATYRAGNNPGIWLVETGRGVFSRLTSSPGLNPVWSPDGRTILFSRIAVYRIGTDGSGIEERVTQSPNTHSLSDWSRDGRFIIYTETAPDTGRDLWVLPVTPEGRPSPGAKPWPFVRERFDQLNARFSPDTRWVAYQSDESGQFELYVRSFPEPHEKYRISTGGGAYPQWGLGGRELYYQSRDGKLMLVTMTPTGASLNASLPRALFALPVDIVRGPNPYEAAPDGQRFLVSDVAPSPEPLTVIVNWPALLKKGAAVP